MKTRFARDGFLTGILLFMAMAWTGSSIAEEDKYSYYFEAKLSGLKILPSIYTPAYGTLTTEIDPYGKYIYYKLYYEKLSAKATAAHIHFGQKYADGGAIAFLCGGPKPACPAYGGWVEGKIKANDIIGPKSQGIYPGDIKSAIRVMKKGLTYGNVHNSKYPAGELRGQLYPVTEDGGMSGM
ncbi:hypothetical protein MNBD_GAMMA21-1485 [hydrothermal vent metagenome]|uniref:CHRD domain-containing protein n=1 Tax=hydrothermal vent metagenome TaxID=652676 RepID=A0A3B0ZQ14_9ZZZZ